jgi:hypothetical protein
MHLKSNKPQVQQQYIIANALQHHANPYSPPQTQQMPQFNLQDALQMSSPNSIINQRLYLNNQTRAQQHQQQQQPPMTSVIQQLKRVLPLNGNVPAIDAVNNKLYEDGITNGVMFQGINRPTPMLDNEPSKFKSSLIKRGSLASRHLPQQQQQQIPVSYAKNSQGEDDDTDDNEDNDFDLGINNHYYTINFEEFVFFV